MSHSPPEAVKYEAIFDGALKSYKKKTGKDLKSDPLLRTLMTPSPSCNGKSLALTNLRIAITGSQTGLIQW
jgi:hypothetical protein